MDVTLQTVVMMMMWSHVSTQLVETPPSVSPWQKQKEFVRSPLTKTITCNAKGNPTPTYTWIYEDKRTGMLMKVPTNSMVRYSKTTGVLTLSSQFDDYYTNANYTCIASNKLGKAMSPPLSIQTAFMSSFPGSSGQLSEIMTAFTSQYLKMECKNVDMIISRPPMEIIWQKGNWDGPELKTTKLILAKNMAIDPEGSLHFLWLRESDFDFVYVCATFNNALQSTHQNTHSLKLLSITGSKSDRRPQLAYISDVTAMAGTIAKLTCIFSYYSTTNENLKITWRFRGEIVGEGWVLSFPVVVPNASLDQSGIYMCEAQLGSMRADGRVKLTIISPPTWKEGKQLLSTTAPVDMNVVFQCGTDSYQTYQEAPVWYVNGDKLLTGSEPIDVRGFSVSSDRKSLTLFNVKLTDMMCFQCSVKNRHGLLYGNGCLTVIDKLEILYGPNETYNVQPNMYINIGVDAMTNSKFRDQISYNWIWWNETQDANGNKFIDPIKIPDMGRLSQYFRIQKNDKNMTIIIPDVTQEEQNKGNYEDYILLTKERKYAVNISQPYETVFLNFTLIGVEITPPTSTCEAVEDRYGLKWNRISASSRDRNETACPPGHTGEVYRRCDENAVWQETVYNCTADTLNKLRQEIQEQSTNVTSLLKKLVSFTNNASALEHQVGNVQATTDILGDIVKMINWTEPVADDVVEDFLEVADNLMEENTTASWRIIITETKSGVDKVLTSIDKFVEKVAKAGNSSGKTVELAKSNFYVRVGRIQESAKDITFPDRTSANVPFWTKHSVDSIVFPVHQSTGNVSYSSSIYKDLREMLPEQLHANDSESEKIELNSPVMSLTLFTERRSLLQKQATITFQQFEGNFKRPKCVFWNEESIGWDKKGCLLESYDTVGGVVVCQCSHLTNFAVLMSHAPATKVHREILGIFSIIGCVVSMLCLVVTFALYLHHWNNAMTLLKVVKIPLRGVGGVRAILLLHLCVVLFLAYFVFLLGVDRVSDKSVCTAVAVILHFLYLTVFFIMLAKSVFLAKMLLWPMNRTPITKTCLLLAYGSSTLVVSISMGITKLQGYGTDTTCWLSIKSGLLWAFVGPALLVMAFNAVVVVIVLKIKFSTRAMGKKTNKEKISSGLRNILVLLPVMGITWVFGVFSVNEDTVVFQYLFALCNSLQGFLIFIFHCLLDHKMRKQVNKSVRKTIRKVRPPENDLAKMKSTSGTQKTMETNLSLPSTSQHDGP